MVRLDRLDQLPVLNGSYGTVSEVPLSQIDSARVDMANVRLWILASDGWYHIPMILVGDVMCVNMED